MLSASNSAVEKQQHADAIYRATTEIKQFIVVSECSANGGGEDVNNGVPKVNSARPFNL